MLTNQITKLGIVISLACSIGLSGCGSGSATTEVFGKVTVAGKPIEDGDITFQPSEGSGFTSSGKITNGEYRLSGENGLLQGTYLVKVNAYRESKNKNNMIGAGLDMPPLPEGEVQKDQVLPEKYNAKSTIEKLVVPSGKSELEHNLDLK